MSLAVRPQREDYFPATRRGHGTTHPHVRTDERTGRIVRDANPCVEVSCCLNAPKSSNLHRDTEANLRDWCDERRLSVRSKDRPHGQHYAPMNAMIAVTGGNR